MDAPLDASAAAVLLQVDALNAQLDSMHAMPNQIDFEAEDNILSVRIDLLSLHLNCIITPCHHESVPSCSYSVVLLFHSFVDVRVYSFCPTLAHPATPSFHSPSPPHDARYLRTYAHRYQP